jgi:hypothetical protein
MTDVIKYTNPITMNFIPCSSIQPLINVLIAAMAKGNTMLAVKIPTCWIAFPENTSDAPIVRSHIFYFRKSTLFI